MNVQDFIAHHFSQFEESKIKTIRPLSGGDINDVYKVSTARENYVVKINRVDRFPEMFEKEAKGLKLLSSCDAVEVPEVVYHDDSGERQILVMTFVQRGSATDFQMGEGLAALHQVTQQYYGLSYDNYIGSLPQYNVEHQDWPSFLAEQRWQQQLAMMSPELKAQLSSPLEALIQKIPELLSPHRPALLHGDLWSGNYFPGQKGPVLYDPAVYFGDPIVDLAMMELFGSIAPATEDAYLQNSTLQPDWKNLIPLYQIYPLMVHVNLFGSSYLGGVKRAINTYL